MCCEQVVPHIGGGGERGGEKGGGGGGGGGGELTIHELKLTLHDSIIYCMGKTLNIIIFSVTKKK